MKTEEIRSKIRRLIIKANDSIDSESLDDTFLLLGEGGNFDSTAALQLVLDIEDAFGIVVDDAEIHPNNFRSLDALTKFIQRKVSPI